MTFYLCLLGRIDYIPRDTRTLASLARESAFGEFILLSQSMDRTIKRLLTVLAIERLENDRYWMAARTDTVHLLERVFC